MNSKAFGSKIKPTEEKWECVSVSSEEAEQFQIADRARTSIVVVFTTNALIRTLVLTATTIDATTAESRAMILLASEPGHAP